MLRKTKEQSVLEMFNNDVFQKDSYRVKEVISQSKDDRIKQVSEEQKSRKLSGFDPVISNGSSIISARAGNMTDMGGPNRHVQTDISNTIFDNNKISSSLSDIDSKTLTKIEKEEISTNRRKAEQSRMDDLVIALKNTDQSKSSSIFRTGTGDIDASNYKAPTRNISIFDNKNFEKIPEKTVGEKVSEDVSLRKSQKDESWKNNGKSITSKAINNNFFDNLINNLENK
jgi:hypothetical protein